jgi:hypothetical protein
MRAVECGQRVSPALIFLQMFYEVKICLRKSCIYALLMQAHAACFSVSAEWAESAVSARHFYKHQTSACIEKFEI